MNMIKDYVNFKLTHADKTAEVKGYPLIMQNCKKHKPMRDLKIYGNSYQSGTPALDAPIDVQSVGELVTDENDANYGKYKIPIVARGINLFDKGNLKAFGNKWNVKNVINTDTGVLITPNGVVNSGGATTGSCYLKIGLASQYAGKTLTLTSPVSYSNATKLMIVSSSDNSTIKQGNNFTLKDGLYYSTLSIEENTYTDEVLVIRLYFNTTDLTITEFEFKNIMIAEGSAITPYEPYVEPITTDIFLSEPLRKLGDYADYIDFKNNKVVRKCCKRNLVDYMWNFSSLLSNEMRYVFVVTDNTILPKLEINEGRFGYSDIFPLLPYSELNTGTFGIFMHTWAQNVRAVIPIDYLQEGTSNSFKSWLEEYNPYMLRILATPTEEPLNIDLPKIKAKTTIIEVDTSLAPSDAYAKYIKK